MRKDLKEELDKYEPPKHRSRKDRKTWCRGKKGVEHDAVWKNWAEIKQWAFLPKKSRYEVLVCTNCGKQLSFRNAE